MKKIITLMMISFFVTVACSNQSDQESITHHSGMDSTDNPLQMTVYKSPTCGCCAAWVTYLEEEGFSVSSIDTDDMDTVKAKLGLPSKNLASCHTAVIDDYLIEGHVPALDIKTLLTEKPTGIRGLAAPGMPALSPGMGSREPKDYDVLSFSDTGETAIFSSY